ncbi:MAG: hypothetical protein LUE17_07075, partial [Planctomycetaceae bacterium]|nr:hypothetical protein [Planctomycetaceae bacterium]
SLYKLSGGILHHILDLTGRAGRQGAALSFCDVSERSLLRDIERLIAISIPIESDHPLAGSAPQTEVRGGSAGSFAPRRRGGDNRSTHRSTGNDRRSGGRPQRRGKTQDRYKKSA